MERGRSRTVPESNDYSEAATEPGVMEDKLDIDGGQPVVIRDTTVAIANESRFYDSRDLGVEGICYGRFSLRQCKCNENAELSMGALFTGPYIILQISHLIKFLGGFCSPGKMCFLLPYCLSCIHL